MLMGIFVLVEQIIPKFSLWYVIRYTLRGFGLAHKIRARL